MDYDAIVHIQGLLNSNPRLSSRINNIKQEYTSSSIMMYHSFNGESIETYVGFKETPLQASKDIQLNYPYIANLDNLKSFTLYPLNFNLTLDNKHIVLHHKSLRRRSTQSCGGYRASLQLERIYLSELLMTINNENGSVFDKSEIDLIVQSMINDKIRGV